MRTRSLLVCVLLILERGLAVSAAHHEYSLQDTFRAEFVEAVSPDGRLILLFRPYAAVVTYRLPQDVFSGRKLDRGVSFLRIVEVASSKELAKVEVKDTNIVQTAWYPDSRAVLYRDPLAEASSFIRWELGTQRQVRLAANKGGRYGRLIAIDSGSWIGVWQDAQQRPFLIRLSVPSFQHEYELRVQAAEFRSLDLSPNRQMVACILHAKTGSTLIVRSSDLAVIREIPPPDEGRFEKLLFHPDSRRLALLVTDSHFESVTYQIRIYDALSGELLQARSYDEVQSMSFSPDGRLFAVGRSEERAVLLGKQVRAIAAVQDWETGAEVARVAHPWVREQRNNPWVGRLGRMMFTVDGQYFITSNGVPETRVWKVD